MENSLFFKNKNGTTTIVNCAFCLFMYIYRHSKTLGRLVPSFTAIGR